MSNLIIINLFIIILASFILINMTNTISSIICLIIIFLFSTILFLQLEATFIAVVLFIVYVGAISILFLFVVMMLNLRIAKTNNIIFNNKVIIYFFLFLIFFEICITFDKTAILTIYFLDSNLSFLKAYNSMNNASLIGQLLFNHFPHYFIIVSMLLYVAMIGSIVLILDFKNDIKKPFKIKNNVIIWLK